MIDFFQFDRKSKSHYEQEAQGPKIHVSKFLNSNEKIVEACKHLDDYAREYIPAKELTEMQKMELQKGQIEKEIRRYDFDQGFWLSHTKASTFRIIE